MLLYHCITCAVGLVLLLSLLLFIIIIIVSKVRFSLPFVLFFVLLFYFNLRESDKCGRITMGGHDSVSFCSFMVS